MAVKIAVIGDIDGRFSEVFGKLATLQAKQSFAFAIVAGNLFSAVDETTSASDEELFKLLRNNISIPLPTYFSLGSRPLPSTALEKLSDASGELCSNLFILGRKVSIKTSEGLSIVAIGGAHLETPAATLTDFDAIYADQDVESAKSFKEPHFLVTSDWPADIRENTKTPYQGKVPTQVKSISELCTALKPRYHFSTSESFYEREPFTHANTPSVTRFISLAPFGNPSKQKWIYAFTFDPEAAPPRDGLTASPFTAAKRKRTAPEPNEPNSFRFSNGNNARVDHDSRRNKRRRGHAQAPPTPNECYFCLSNPTCETHMIGAIGTHSYLTIAKGPLSNASTFPGLGLPCHLLLISVVHAPTIATFPAHEEPGATFAELQRYREALHSLVAAKSSDPDGRARLGAVTWEIGRRGGVHLHWQFLPMPADLIHRGLVEAAFDVEAENAGYGKLAKNSDAIASAVGDPPGSGGGDYFKAMLWTETTHKELVLPFDPGMRFDLQFGRRVLAKLLGVEDRAHWRDCAQTQAEEEADAAAFKEAFRDFDFALAESSGNP